MIDWAKQTLAFADFSKGIGIAGHSMGGQATVFSASYSNASQYNIKAAVMHHAYTHSYPPPQVPFLAMTGANDHVASAAMTENFFNAPDANPHRVLRNKLHADHLEPLSISPTYDHFLPQFTAAWFKIFLDETPQDLGIDFEEMIFGNSSSSLCAGGDGKMQECVLHR